MVLAAIEHELRKRLHVPYHWGQKQNDEMDRQTNFIYHIREFSPLIDRIRSDFSSKPNYQEYFDYAVNRWYNFWSAQAVEHIFCTHHIVTPHTAKDKMKDFSVKGISFDHKTSIFPRGFRKSFTYATAHKRELIQWLYHNQSQQQRHHCKNRLFIVLYKTDGNHWQLKAEIGLLQKIIDQYLSSFDPGRLEKFNFGPTEETLSDILWGLE